MKPNSSFRKKLSYYQMLKQLQMGLRTFLLYAQKIWSFICFILKKQIRVVSFYDFVLLKGLGLSKSCSSKKTSSLICILFYGVKNYWCLFSFRISNLKT